MRQTESTEPDVVVVSAHHLLRHSLEQILGASAFNVTSCRSLDQVKPNGDGRSYPKVLLFEPEAGTPVVEQLRQVHQKGAGWSVVLILKTTGDIDLGSAVRAGAAGCVTQETPPEAISALIRLVLSGFIVWPRTLPEEDGFARRASDNGAQEHRRHPADLEQKLALLSRREKEVLGFVARGMGNKRIASALHISDTTVRLHMRSIMRKLGVENRAQVVIYALHV